MGTLNRSFGERAADIITAILGSWPFIIIQTCAIAVWVAVNVVAWWLRWDPYPFILLNLGLSTQAAYAAPVIMMSQNRLARADRELARRDYRSSREFEDLTVRLLKQMDENELTRTAVLTRLESLVLELELMLRAQEENADER